MWVVGEGGVLCVCACGSRGRTVVQSVLAALNRKIFVCKLVPLIYPFFTTHKLRNLGGGSRFLVPPQFFLVPLSV